MRFLQHILTLTGQAILVLLIVFISSNIFAQNTGKINGQVTDDQTGEPLIGANVMVEGTQLGAATDDQGQYVILNVPPGKQTLRFNYIGYKTVKVEDIEVKIGRTTTINVQMSQTALETGEVVTVTATRPVVEKDKTSSSQHFEAREVESLPVEGLRNVLELNAGVTKNPDGTMSIRGGGAYEINYTVNGIQSLNTNTGIPAYGTGTKANTSWKYDVNPLSVAQMEVISGGFNAEYGNAQSGVVQVVTKEGGADFSGAFRVVYSPPGKYHWGDYLYSKDQYEWRKWGDFNRWLQQEQFQDTTGATTTVDTFAARTNYNLWIKNHTPSPDNILGVYDYTKYAYQRYLFSFGGPLSRDGRKMSFFYAGEVKFDPTRLPTREKVQKLQNHSLVLAVRPSDQHNFKFTGMYQSYYSGMGSGSDDIRWSGLWGSYGAKRKYTLVYDSPRKETVFAQSLNYKYILSAKTYLETAITHQSEVLYALQTPTPSTATDQQQHPNLENRILEEQGPWQEKYRTYYTWSSLYNQASVTNYYQGNVDFSSQVTNNHLIKAGVSGWLMDQNYNASSSLAVSAFIWRTGFATNYKADSWYAASYIQDKMEFAGLVANIGMRMDAYNFGADVPANKFAVFYPAQGAPARGIPEWEKSKTYITYSPRLGISFPIAERTAFRVQYGHFRSMPIMNRALDNQTNYGWGSYGNPNLKPQLSVNYEVGIQQNLWDTHQLDVVTYYNDLKDQISTVYIKSTTGSQNRTGDLKGTYISYENNGYGNSRGIEISFRNVRGLRWQYRISYALSQTNYGYYGTYIEGQDLSETLLQKYQYSASDFLGPNDRTHRFNGSITYFLDKDAGPKFMSFRPFSNVSVSLILQIRSGTAYFWSPEYQTEYQVESNRRYPPESQTDLRIEKSHQVGGLTFNGSIRVLNLFDNQQLTPISDSQELDRWVQRSVTYADPGNNPTRDVRIYNYFQTYRNIPRQFFFEIGVSF